MNKNTQHSLLHRFTGALRRNRIRGFVFLLIVVEKLFFVGIVVSCVSHSLHKTSKEERKITKRSTEIGERKKGKMEMEMEMEVHGNSPWKLRVEILGLGFRASARKRRKKEKKREIVFLGLGFWEERDLGNGRNVFRARDHIFIESRQVRWLAVVHQTFNPPDHNTWRAGESQVNSINCKPTGPQRALIFLSFVSIFFPNTGTTERYPSLGLHTLQKISLVKCHRIHCHK